MIKTTKEREDEEVKRLLDTDSTYKGISTHMKETVMKNTEAMRIICHEAQREIAACNIKRYVDRLIEMGVAEDQIRMFSGEYITMNMED